MAYDLERERALNSLEDVLISFGATSETALFSDTPIRIGVWREIAADPNRRQRLLIELNNRVRFNEAIEELLSARPLAGGFADQQLQSLSTGDITIVKVDMEELILMVLPQTVWFRQLDSRRIEAWWVELHSAVDAKNSDELHGVITQSESLILWRFLCAWLAIRNADKAAEEGGSRWGRLNTICEALLDVTQGAFGRSFEREHQSFHLTLEFLRDGLWKYGSTLTQLIEAQKNAAPAATAPIWRVDISRRADLATHISRRTVKVDAAENVFDIKCSGLIWAVIDSGIDATHPAFRNRNSDHEGALGSRVQATYDFTRLQKFLDGDWDLILDPKTTRDVEKQFPDLSLPDAILSHLIQQWLRSAPKRSKSMLLLADVLSNDISAIDLAKVAGQIKAQITQGHHLDWPLLEPLLWVPHDDLYIPPQNGHGTHVAGILAGDLEPNEADAGDGLERVDISLKGMCPDLRLMDLRVCDENGNSDEFVVMAALQFVAWLNRSQRRRIVHGVNVSLQLRHIVRSYGCGQTPVCREANTLVLSGVLVVAAAGNTGYNRLRSESSGMVEAYGSSTIMDPGNAEHVLTVGSVHSERPHTHGISYFSSRGPTVDGRTKPDVVAPGEKVLAPTLHRRILRDSGTSMAAPHASGAAALLMARFPELQGRPFDVKSLIIRNATSLDRDPTFQGHGLVDVLRALQQN